MLDDSMVTCLNALPFFLKMHVIKPKEESLDNEYHVFPLYLNIPLFFICINCLAICDFLLATNPLRTERLGNNVSAN